MAFSLYRYIVEIARNLVVVGVGVCVGGLITYAAILPEPRIKIADFILYRIRVITQRGYRFSNEAVYISSPSPLLGGVIDCGEHVRTMVRRAHTPLFANANIYALTRHPSPRKGVRQVACLPYGWGYLWRLNLS